MISHRCCFYDFNHIPLRTAGLMGQPALPFADLLDDTGRQYGPGMHVKELIFD
jgi:hypothetical protein